MAVRIRLQRMGAKKRPFYRVVVTDSRTPRAGRCLKVLGTYDPKTDPASVRIDREQATAWIRKGAQVTQTVGNLFAKIGIVLSAK